MKQSVATKSASNGDLPEVLSKNTSAPCLQKKEDIDELLESLVEAVILKATVGPSTAPTFLDDRTDENGKDKGSQSQSSSSSSESESESESEPEVEQGQYKLDAAAHLREEEKLAKLLSMHNLTEAEPGVHVESLEKDVCGPLTENEKPQSESTVLELPTEVLGEQDEIVEIGKVLNVHVAQRTLVIESCGIDKAVLEVNSVVCSGERQMIGRVEDVFGPVDEPFYVVHIQNNTVLQQLDPSKSSPENTCDLHGKQMFAVKKYLLKVDENMIEEQKKQKGSDASNKYNEEIGEQERDFSDDEAEKLYKAKRKQKHKLVLGLHHKPGARNQRPSRGMRPQHHRNGERHPRYQGQMGNPTNARFLSGPQQLMHPADFQQGSFSPGAPGQPVNVVYVPVAVNAAPQSNQPQPQHQQTSQPTMLPFLNSFPNQSVQLGSFPQQASYHMMPIQYQVPQPQQQSFHQPLQQAQGNRFPNSQARPVPMHVNLTSNHFHVGSEQQQPSQPFQQVQQMQQPQPKPQPSDEKQRINTMYMHTNHQNPYSKS